MLLITDELGGRVCYDPELHNNFGAVFCMKNYDNAFKIVDKDGYLEVALGSLMLHSTPTKKFKGTEPHHDLEPAPASEVSFFHEQGLHP